MTVLQKIACLQNRRDEVPNQELARELVNERNFEGIREISENLSNPNPDIQNDCIKVLYEIGYLQPELIAGYTDRFLRLLRSPHNRMVWGAMLALSTVAHLAADEIYAQHALIIKTMQQGSVITVDNGVKVLAEVAARNEQYSSQLFPFLLEHLRTCRPKDVPQHCEKVQAAANVANKTELINVLTRRLEDLTGGQVTRVKKVIRNLEKIE